VEKKYSTQTTSNGKTALCFKITNRSSPQK